MAGVAFFTGFPGFIGKRLVGRKRSGVRVHGRAAFIRYGKDLNGLLVIEKKASSAVAWSSVGVPFSAVNGWKLPGEVGESFGGGAADAAAGSVNAPAASRSTAARRRTGTAA